jgi:PAS domain S-box-containing protein
VQTSHAPELQRQLSVTNLFALTVTLVTILWGGVFAATGQGRLSGFVFAVSMLCAGSLLFSARGHFVAARLWLLGWSNLAIFAFAILLGPSSGMSLLFMATTCAPLALFDPKDNRVPFLASLIAPAGLTAAAQYFSTQHAPLHPLPAGVLGYLLPATLVTTIVLLVFIVSYYYYVFERNRSAREQQHRVEQARLDGALRESEQRYALAAEGANDGLWEWSASAGHVFYSDRWKSILGFASHEIGTSIDEWLSRVHPEDRSRVEHEIRDQMVGKSERLRSEFRMRDKQGRYRWMLGRGIAQRDAQGHAVRMAGWMTDITERRLSLDRLSESEALFRQLVAQAADALYFFDTDGGIRDVSRRAEVDLGYTRAELLARSLYDIDKELAPGQIHELTKNIPRDGPMTIERVHRRKDGSAMPVEVRVGWFDFGGKRHLLASVRDIAVRKEIEAQLLLADRMVSVGTLAAGVAHEVNNPLTSLLLNLELVDRLLVELNTLPISVFRERAAKALERAREGAERVGVIVRDLKTFSRGDADLRDAVDLRRVIESTLNLAHPELKRRAHVSREMPADLPAVRANEARLGQLFLNLLLNASQAFDGENTENNRIRVRVYVEKEQVIAEVIDTGRGIREDILPRIFDPFFTTKPVGVGTGLGLYICRNIVEGAGGTLTCESQLGIGSVFRASFPTVRSLADGTERFSPVGKDEREVARRGSIPPPGLLRARVLVVDDYPDVAASLQAVLVDHDVELSLDAQEAREKLENQVFDLVLCDLDLFQREFSTLEPLVRGAPERWVLATGGTPASGMMQHASALGIRLVEKPVRSELLWSLLHERTRGGYKAGGLYS